MVKIIDNKGEVLLELDENRFPITLPVKTIWGLKEYQINLYYLNSKDGVKTDNIKSLNVNITNKNTNIKKEQV